MDIKQGKEKGEFVKEEDQRTRNYIFQKNKKTKIGFIITVTFLILLVLGLILSGVFFEN